MTNMTPTKKHKEIVNDILAFASDFPEDIISEVVADYLESLKNADGLSNTDAAVIGTMLWARGF